MGAQRVLVVDDDPDYRLLVRLALAPGDGFEVVAEAGDGGAAVAEAQREQPDLVLLDCTLRKPVPTGVVSGPLRATRVFRNDSSVASGRISSPASTAERPASRSSHAISAPAASSTRRAESTTSGPIPSPLMSVTVFTA